MFGNKKYLLLLAMIVGYLLPSFAVGAVPVVPKWRTGYYANQEPFATMLPLSDVPWQKYTHVIQGFIVPIFIPNPNNVGIGEVGIGGARYGVMDTPAKEATSFIRGTSATDIAECIPAIPAAPATPAILGNAKAFVDEAHKPGNNTKALVSIIVGEEQACAMERNTSPTNSNVNTFVSVLKNFIELYNYDGIDIDWEAFSSVGKYKTQFPEFIRLLREALPGKIITVAGSADFRSTYAYKYPDGTYVYDKVDQINVMNYDMDRTTANGKDSSITWFNTAVRLTPCLPICNPPYPLQPFKYDYSYPDPNDPTQKIHGTNNWTQDEKMWLFYNGYTINIPRAKLGVGVPFYGYIKRATQLNSADGVTAPRQTYLLHYDPVEKKDVSDEVRTQVSYSQLMNCINTEPDPSRPPIYKTRLSNNTLLPCYSKNGMLKSDTIQKAPYISYLVPKSQGVSFDLKDPNSDAFVTFTDPKQIAESMKLLNEKGLGGIMTFALNHEYHADKIGDDRYPLTMAIAADLSVTITGSANLVVPNEAVTYTVTVMNAGPSQATGVIVAGLVDCILPVTTLDSGTTTSCSSTVTVSSAGALTQTVKVSGEGYDPNSNNDTASVTTNVQAVLSVSKTGNGTITAIPAGINCGTTCSARYDANTSVTLTATAANDSVFGSWSGCDSVASTGCTVGISASRSVTANFNGLPDLVVSTVSGPTNATRGANITVNATTANTGTAAVAVSATALYLSTDATIAVSDIPLGSMSISGLAAGATSPNSANVMLSSTLVTGTYYLGAIADATGAVVEGNATATGESNNAKTGNVIQISGVPAAPSNLTATVNSRSKIALNWTDNATDETGFKIERSTNGTTFDQITKRGSNVKTYTNSDLSADTVYYYRVRAYNARGNSTYSNIVSATTNR